MTTTTVTAHTVSNWRNTLIERMRVVIVAGIFTGVLVAGVVSRLAMFVLRLTSPDQVNGIESDDGFTIGEVTLAGSYNLALLGTAVGIIGVGVYRVVSPWLIGPSWFRRVSCAVGAGIVVGSMLVHTDGVDFTLLKPTWFAIALFILVPAIFGLMIGPVVDSVGSADSWTARGIWRWLLPVVSVAAFPFAIVFVAFALLPVGFMALARETDFAAEIRTIRWLPNVIRAGFTAIVVLGLVSLINDVIALT